jgi:hypothetical protein
MPDRLHVASPTTSLMQIHDTVIGRLRRSAQCGLVQRLNAGVKGIQGLGAASCCRR